MRTRGISTRAPPPPPRHATPLPRTTGIRKVMWELKRFSVVDTKFERRASSAAACSLRLTSCRSLFASFSCAYIREGTPLQRDTAEDPLPLATKFLSTALLLRSSPSRLAACTAGRDSRPPKPHLLSHVREKGDKVFGERSARLLAASSRTIRSPTTSSPMSTTSSTTWQARTPTPSPALLLLLSRTCSCLSC